MATASLMDSKKSEKELLSNPRKLLEYLGERTSDMAQSIDDDEAYCSRKIDIELNRLMEIEQKFNEEIRKLRQPLENLRIENETASEKNRQRHETVFGEINEHLRSNKYEQALAAFQHYEKLFEQRPLVLSQVPKLKVNKTDVEKLFSSDPKVDQISTCQNPVQIQSSTTIDDDEFKEPIEHSSKQKFRKRGAVEEVDFTKPDDEDKEEIARQNQKSTPDQSAFGQLSKIRNNQQIVQSNSDTSTENHSSTRNNTPMTIKSFSTRLKLNSESRNPSPTNQNNPTPSPVQNPIVNTKLNNSNPTFVPIKTQSPCSVDEISLELTPVSVYRYEPKLSLLIACDSQYIVCFKNSPARVDQWQLGAIQRRSHQAESLPWHDGVLTSLDCLRNCLFMFTEREFSVYSIAQHRKLMSRILPRGNDDRSDVNFLRTNELERGIGTISDEYVYHIFLNRSDMWTLSQSSLNDTLTHLCDFKLTESFPDVYRFIQLCVNDEAINFLVQMADSSYAVLFGSLHDCKPMANPIILESARQPQSICSAYIESIKQYVLFVNDPSIQTLHILTIKRYLKSYSIECYAMYKTRDKSELMIVTMNSISSIQLQRQNEFFRSLL